MRKSTIDFEMVSGPVLDRVITAYGFTSKMMLTEHLGMAASSLSGRYKRGGFPADIVVRCIEETGASLEWLATGNGKKFDSEELDVLKMPRQKIVDGHLYDAGIFMLDKAAFLQGKPVPTDPTCILDGINQYIVERQFSEIYDDEWLVEIEGKLGVRTLTRIPVKKVRISGVGMAFDCGIDEINVIGRVVLTIK